MPIGLTIFAIQIFLQITEKPEFKKMSPHAE
jgi:hypothetical protein